MLQRVAISEFQYAAVHYSVLQCTTVCCSTNLRSATSEFSPPLWSHSQTRSPAAPAPCADRHVPCCLLLSHGGPWRSLLFVHGWSAHHQNRCWWQFSTVSSSVILHGKCGSELIFENFGWYAHHQNKCSWFVSKSALLSFYIANMTASWFLRISGDPHIFTSNLSMKDFLKRQLAIRFLTVFYYIT